jgi:hypothetical protein
MVTGSCGHTMYAGYVAELDHLQQRSTWLVERVRGAEPAPPPELAKAYGVWDVRGAAPVTSAVLRDGGGGAGLPTLLLALGALLLAVAAVVFTAVAWPRLGAIGQVLLVLAATASAVTAAIILRHRLRGTAEAFAALSVGLALVSAAAAPALGLLPRAWASAEAGYWSVVLLGLGALAVAASHRWSLRSWSWLGWGVMAAGVAVTAGTVVDAVGADDGVAVVALAAGLTAIVGVAIGTSSWWAPDGRDDRGPTVVAGCGLVLGAGGVVAAVALSQEAVLAAAGAGALTGVALLVADRRVPVLRSARSWPGPLGGAGVVLLAAAAGVALAAPDPVPALAVLAATLGAALLAVGLHVRHVRLALAAALGAWVGWWSVAATSAVVDGAPGVFGADSAAGFLIVVGLSLGLSAYGARDDELVRLVAWPGAFALFAALVLLAPEGYPSAVEGWSLPLAGLLAVAGAVSCSGRAVSTAQRWGPAVAVALLPSALATWDAPWVPGGESGTVGWPLLRLVLVLVVSAAVLVVGVRLRSLGLVVPAAAAVLLAGLAQLWTGLQALPRWLALALVGAGLVAAGARFEWVRAEGRRARGWLRELR